MYVKTTLFDDWGFMMIVCASINQEAALRHIKKKETQFKTSINLMQWDISQTIYVLLSFNHKL